MFSARPTPLTRLAAWSFRPLIEFTAFVPNHEVNLPTISAREQSSGASPLVVGIHAQGDVLRD